MDHSGNEATTIDTTYELGCARVKVYVHDELGRFLTVARLTLTKSDLEHHLLGIRGRQELEADKAQLALPPWQ